MKIYEYDDWHHYAIDNLVIDNFVKDITGKWMYFFDNHDFINAICEEAIQSNVIPLCKHSADATGVACFYLPLSDYEGHLRVIDFFLKKNLIALTRTGRLYNISFKLDIQTLQNKYGKDFNAFLRLKDFLDLNTRKVIMSKEVFKKKLKDILWQLRL